MERVSGMGIEFPHDQFERDIADIRLDFDESHFCRRPVGNVLQFHLWPATGEIQARPFALTKEGALRDPISNTR